MTVRQRRAGLRASRSMFAGPTGADDDDDESGSGGGGGKVNLKRVEAKLDKLNENVERLAVSLEKLVEIMAAKK